MGTGARFTVDAAGATDAELGNCLYGDLN